MRTTTTLERLTQKPLNAKYYPMDFESPKMVEVKKDNFFQELAKFVMDVLAAIKNQKRD
jgi:hypothetical protein